MVPQAIADCLLLFNLGVTGACIANAVAMQKVKLLDNVMLSTNAKAFSKQKRVFSWVLLFLLSGPLERCVLFVLAL